MIIAIFDLQVTLMLPTKFQVSWPLCSGEEAKNRFSRWRPCWISDQKDYSCFYLHVTLMLPTKFQINWPFGSKDKKNRFSNWQQLRPSWSPIRMILAIFDLQVIPLLPTKLQVNWPFSSVERSEKQMFTMAVILEGFYLFYL